MDRLIQDVRFAFRKMRTAPAFTFVIVTILALGIGASSAAISYVRGIETIPAPGVRPSDQLVQLGIQRVTRGQRPRVEYPSYATFAQLSDSLRSVVRIAGEERVKSAVDFGGGARATAVLAIT